jgi:type IV pilus assembly protein PilC
MTKFNYKAVNRLDEAQSGTLEAVDRNTAIATLRKQNLRPISINLDGISQHKKGSLDLFKPKVKTMELVIFTRQLSTMVSAGVPLLRSLNSLQAQAENPALKEVLTGVTSDVESGISIGEALAKYPKVFSSVYVNMVKAGEAGGILDDILKKVATEQEKNASMKKKIKGAMTYPIVLLSITVVAFFGLMIFIVPQIGKMIKNLGGPDAKLPAITEIMLGISDFMQHYWYIVIGSLTLVVWLFLRWKKTAKGKKTFHALILKAPTIGVIIQKVAVARFARTFSALMGAGMGVLEALTVTGRVIGNESYEEILKNAAMRVQQGEQLSVCIAGEKLFPPIVAQMLAVGEETGQTDTVLLKIADFYEEEVQTAIDSASSILEPVMIVIMGAMVGLIAASVMGPISNLANQIN